MTGYDTPETYAKYQERPLYQHLRHRDCHIKSEQMQLIVQLIAFQ
jgi:hypothetical protein